VDFLWGGISVISFLWCYFRLPETKGRTFEEIDYLFENHIPTRKFKTYVIQEEDLKYNLEEKNDLEESVTWRTKLLKGHEEGLSSQAVLEVVKSYEILAISTVRDITGVSKNRYANLNTHHMLLFSIIITNMIFSVVELSRCSSRGRIGV
jgi:hypothetical protein